MADQEKTGVFVIGISSSSGGGKTEVTKRLSELLSDAVTVFFDDYDFDTAHPESIHKWLEDGADYNAWKTPRLANDLRKLKEGKAISSPVDGRLVQPSRYVVFDAPLGYTHAETGYFIDLMVFLDTPLDIAMARRVLRDAQVDTSKSLEDVVVGIKSQLNAYLDYGRQAYLEMDRQIKPSCDLILDGCLSVDELAQRIVTAIESLSD